MKLLCIIALFTAISEALLSGAGAQIITYTDLHPADASAVSRAFATAGGQQVGSAAGRAGIWSGTASSFVDLNPEGAISSFAYAVTASQQAGHAYFGDFQAGIWSGTAGSFVSLHPAGYSSSFAYAAAGGQQAGSATFGNLDHAAVWSGSAASFVDMHPAGLARSAIQSTTGSQQAGVVWLADNGNVHAALWSGTAVSFVDLNPAGSTASAASAIVGNQQAGYASVGSASHAALWSGTAGSFVDLHPAGYVHSYINASTGLQQAGYTWFNGEYHAGIWSGTSESFVDLDVSLGAGYGDSYANAIWTDGSTINVAGYARDLTGNNDHAILWTIVPEPNSLTLLGGIALVAGRFFQRKR